MTTLAKNSRAFCPTPAHYTSVKDSVLHVSVHKMQLEALRGNRALFLKFNYKGNCGRTWENSEEVWDLRGSVWICGELWRAYSALWELLVSRRIRMKSKENAWAWNVPASNFRIVILCGRCFPMASHWNQRPQIGSLEGVYYRIHNKFEAISMTWKAICNHGPKRWHCLSLFFFRPKIWVVVL